jgi:hypothetical protein
MFNMPDQLDKKPAVGETSSSRVPVDAPAVVSSVQCSIPSSIITQLSENDVLLGRGEPSILNEGNIRFRQLVQSRKLEYLDADKRKTKDWIARQVVQAISSKQGRFLRRIRSPVEAVQMGVPEGVKAWVRAHEGTIIQKVKQALRNPATWDDDKIQDVEQQVISGDSSPAAGCTQGIDPLKPEYGPYMEGLKQKAVLQRIDRQQQAELRGASSLPSTIGDFLRARQAERHEQQVHADQARARASILDAFQGIDDYHPVAQQGNLPSCLGGTNNGGQLHPGIAELRNAPAGPSFPMAGAYQQLLMTDTIPPSIGLPPAWDAANTLVGSGIARGPAKASEAFFTGKETKGETAIYAAIVRAQQLFAGSLPGSYLKTSMIEMLLLSVLCSHGLPVWEPPNHKSTDERLEGAESGSYMFTWSDFGSLLSRAAKDWHVWIYSSSDLAVNDECRAELRATVLAARYKADLKELARKTTSLLEKLRNFMEPDDSGISAWFEEELCRWAVTLSIADKRMHPVAYSASNFISAHPQYTRDDDVKTACVFDTQSCRHIILQVANMSRLRSVFLSDRGRGIWTKVDEASTISIFLGQVWKRRPPWWGSNFDAISHEMALLQSLLEGGFLGVLEEMSRAIAESASSRELGLSKASIQEHMEVLVPHLHQSQETADRQAILKGLEDQHFSCLLAKPVATSAMDTGINNVQLRPPRRNESTVKREKQNVLRKTSAERHSGGVGAEHPATKKIRNV